MLYSVPDCKSSTQYYIALSTCRKTKISQNIYVYERALKIYLCSLVYIPHTMHNIFQKHDRNLWGPLFVGAPGQLPTLPSPKSGPVCISQPLASAKNYTPATRKMTLLQPSQRIAKMKLCKSILSYPRNRRLYGPWWGSSGRSPLDAESCWHLWDR